MEIDAYLEMEELENSHWWFVGRRKLINSLINRNFDGFAIDILEIGCGTGGNLEMLSHYGSVTGIEMNVYALGSAAASLNESSPVILRQGFAPHNLNLLDGAKFDLICMLDVLEHIPEDIESLLVVKDLLKPGGKAIWTVPSYQWLWSAHDDFNHHKRRYTKRKLKQDLVSCGFQIDGAGYFNSFLFPIAAVARMLQKLLHVKTSKGVKMPNWMINKILKTIFSSERFISQRSLFPFGLSIWALANEGRPTSKL